MQNTGSGWLLIEPWAGANGGGKGHQILCSQKGHQELKLGFGGGGGGGGAYHFL